MIVSRVQYSENRVLQARDLNDEQAYLIALRRSHNLGPHDWGILGGLDLVYRDSTLMLTPGAAVDGFGRELYVLESVLLAESLFQTLYPQAQAGAERQLDFWLRYGLAAWSSPQTGIYPCGPDESNRWQEQARLCATLALRSSDGQLLPVDPRRPPGVSFDDQNFAPYQDPPDDPRRAWPVYLGRVNWIAGADHAEPDPAVRRPYAVLVGAVTHSASRQFVPDDPKNPSPVPIPPVDRTQLELAPALSGKSLFTIRTAASSGEMAEHAAITPTGQVRLSGHTTIVSDLPPAARSAATPLDDERDLVSSLYLESSPVYFTESMIANPGRLARRILAGRLPVRGEHQAEIQKQLTYDPKQKVILSAEQENTVRTQLAMLLNSLVNDVSLADKGLLQDLRLSQGTWEMVRALPTGADYRPLNAQIIADVFAEDLTPDAVLNKAWALEVGKLPAPPTTALPWRLYRLEKQADDGLAYSELRFEILDPGQKDDPTLYQFAIGTAYEQPPAADSGAVTLHPFLACLTVDAACNVTIHGQLQVDGEVVQSPISADPNDPRFVDQLVKGWVQGQAAAIAAAGSLKAKITGGAVDVTNSYWSYDLVLTNLTTKALVNVQAFETFAINGQLGQSRQVATQLILDAGETTKLTIPHTTTLPGSGTIGVVVAVQGLNEDGITAYTSAQWSTSFAPPPS